MIRKQYNDIAILYDMLSEGDDGMIWFRHSLEEVLIDLPVHSKVLDCACGTGDHAIWLAKKGYHVFASDLSEGMLEAAKEKAIRQELNIVFFRSSWTELPAMTSDHFDLVVAPGNSLSHLESVEIAKEVFSSVRKVLNPGGCFFFDIRNWEKTYAENSLETQQFNVSRKGRNFEVIYSYEMPAWNETGKMHVDVRPEGTTEAKRFSFDFLPVSYQQLHDAALHAGFTNVDRGYFPGKDYYYLILS